MADEIRATPRNSLAALLSDAIQGGVGYMKSPKRTQQLQGLGRLIESTGIPYTAQSLSYDPSGRGLFTGAGGLGGTTRMRPEALEAAMTVAPMVGPAARLANRGLMATGRAGEQLAERVVPQIMERGGPGSEIINAFGNRTISPMNVYHGSPHRLPPTERNPLGEFDASMIGTGEGAQAYGHGIYTAENPVVGQEYMFTLGGNLNTKGAGYYPKVNGKVVYDDFEDLDIVRKIAAATDAKAGGIMGRNKRQAISSDEAIAELIAKNKLIADDPVYYPEARSAAQNEIEALSKYLGKNIEPSKPSLYKVDLPDEKIAKMLDWDKPLTEQSLEVRTALAQYMDGSETFISPTKGSLYNPTGKQIYESITKNTDVFSGEGSRIAAEQLRQIGIPGVKYLDEGSRAKGEGTRNFVVFPGEEKSMTILERNSETAASPFYQDPFMDTTR